MMRTKYFAAMVAAILTVFATGCIVSIEPETARNPVGTDHTVTADVRNLDEVDEVAVCEAVIEVVEELVGEEAPEDFCEQFDQFPRAEDHNFVNFEVIQGPNTGTNSDEDGVCLPSCNDPGADEVSWTYTSNGVAGTDVIRVCADDIFIFLPTLLEEMQSEVSPAATLEELEEALLDALGDVFGDDFESEEDLFCETATKTWVDPVQQRPNIGAGLSGLFAGQPTALPTAPAPAAVAPSTTIRPPSTGDAGLK